MSKKEIRALLLEFQVDVIWASLSKCRLAVLHLARPSFMFLDCLF